MKPPATTIYSSIINVQQCTTSFCVCPSHSNGNDSMVNKYGGMWWIFSLSFLFSSFSTECNCQVSSTPPHQQLTTTNSFTTTTSVIGFGLVRTIVQIHPFIMICIILFCIIVTVIWIIDFIIIIIIIVGWYCHPCHYCRHRRHCHNDHDDRTIIFGDP